MLLHEWLRSARQSKLEVRRMSMTYQLLGQRHLLELHLVNASRGGPKQRTGCEDKSVLHSSDKEVSSCRSNNSIS